ncbi:MAG: polysaccharide biosynthesis protein [Blautia sp.]|nr:polysaccharide biosynthesis protein [Blautia sp.]
MKKVKICFAASSGGHLEQLMMLKPLLKKYDGFLVTERTVYHLESGFPRTYFLKQVNRREPLFPVLMIMNSFSSLRIILKERPDVVICTGVLVMIPLCLLAKLFRKKLIYIESFAKVTTPTISGKFLYRFADQFYVQWESMLKVFPDAIYLGGIY